MHFFEKQIANIPSDAPIISHVFLPNTFLFCVLATRSWAIVPIQKYVHLATKKIMQVDHGPPFMIFGAFHDNNNINHAKAWLALTLWIHNRSPYINIIGNTWSNNPF